MSLQVWLPLNGDLRNQGCSNITATNVNATIDNNGKIGKCYNFAGSGQRIKFANPITNGINSFSICTWFYITAVNGGLFGARTSGSGKGLLGFLYADRILFDDGARFICNYNINGLLNSWHHIVFIKTPTQKLIYIDGILVGSQNTTAVTATIKNEITIGNDTYETYTGNDLIGKLNDFRIYDHALSAAEVREISQGLVLHYKLDDMTSTTVIDSSGYNHNGTYAGTVSAYSDSPRYAQCMNLSAAASRINCGRGGMVTDAITVNFWANLPNVPSALSDTTGFVSCAESGGFRIQVGNNAIVRTIIYINSAYVLIEGSTAIQANTWYMITLVYDRMNSKLYEYINGIKDAEVDVVNNKIIGYNSGNVLWIGAEARSGTNYYSAIAEKVSDFRIYCTALDADAIRQLYEVGAKVDNKGNLHTFELNEQASNIFFNIEKARTNLTFTDGLSRYTQSNCQVTLTEDGCHIYRPPNLLRKSSGGADNMFGGLKFVNQSTDTVSEYNSDRDNIWNLQTGHTYILTVHVTGQTHNAASWNITHNMGNGVSVGVAPSPTIIISKGISTDFQGEQDSYCMFTINDNIVKTSTVTRTSTPKYVEGVQYLSYRHIALYFGYGNTGELGTDLYLTNFRLYDITNHMAEFTKMGQAKFFDFVEQMDKAQIRKNSELLSSEFIEL